MTILPSLGHAFFTLGHPFLYLYISPQNYLLFIIYCTNTFISNHYILCRHRWRPALFWPHATHVTLGWSITYHLPLPASSIPSEYPTGQLPLPSEFVHLVPPLAQLSTSPVVPLTLDLVPRLWPLFLIQNPSKGSLESSHFSTLSMYLCHLITSVDSTEHPFASGSRVPLLSTPAHFSRRAPLS